MEINNPQLAALFNPGEIIALKQTLESMPTYDTSSPAQFFCVNPLKVPGKIEGANIAEYRNILIEMDFGSIEEQWKKIEEARLPWTTCVFSGSKSLHFIISISDSFQSEDDYKYVASILTETFGADQSTINPNRLSRLAGSIREGGALQELIEVRKSVTRQELFNYSKTAPMDIRMRMESIKTKLFYRQREQERREQVEEGAKTILPIIYKNMLETGAMHPDTNSRHDSLGKFYGWLLNNWHDQSEVETLLQRAADSMGIGDRGDVDGFLRWKPRRS